jgi:hypothetical protein
MSKLLFVILIALLAFGFLAYRYRRGILFALRIYRQLKEARNGVVQRNGEPEPSALEMRLCLTCNKWFQSKGETICDKCRRQSAGLKN